MDNDSTNTHLDFTLSDGTKLAYRTLTHKNAVDKISAEKRIHVVFCGGFHSTMLGTKAQALETICHDNNLSYTRFDYRGHGQSDGDPASFTLTDWLHDILLILDSTAGPVILVGSSMGGWLATVAATRRHTKIKGLLLLACAPDFIQELVLPRLSKGELWDLQQGQIVNLPNDYDEPYPLTQALLDSAEDVSVFKPRVLDRTTGIDGESNPGQLQCPIRLIHGSNDADVPYELSIRLMNEFKHAQAQLTLLHQADHRLSDERSLECIKQELLLLSRQVQSIG